jgi:hypothetical protein
MDIKELQLQLAVAIDSVAATQRQLGDLASSVMAMRFALSEVSPDKFEPSYAKHYEGVDCEQVRQRSSTDVKLLLAAAKMLRQSA